ncbi:MAG TPA: phosphoribosylformylglycinamidine synthase subunit PurS [Aquificae bacterium]|nr:phosphoribosylformylglycinamidine synthase subunit PurS [Aquificota bacterium]
MFKVKLIVKLKEGVLDPVGNAIASACKTLGFDNVKEVHTGKYIEFLIDAENEDKVKEEIEKLVQNFLVNPIIENYSILEIKKV